MQDLRIVQVQTAFPHLQAVLGVQPGYCTFCTFWRHRWRGNRFGSAGNTFNPWGVDEERNGPHPAQNRYSRILAMRSPVVIFRWGMGYLENKIGAREVGFPHGPPTPHPRFRDAPGRGEEL